MRTNRKPLPLPAWTPPEPSERPDPLVLGFGILVVLGGAFYAFYALFMYSTHFLAL